MLDERTPSPDRGLGTAVLAVMGATALGVALFLLATWNSPHVAHKSAPITVGSSTRPAAAPSTTLEKSTAHVTPAAKGTALPFRSAL